jgi:hypothetical protein
MKKGFIVLSEADVKPRNLWAELEDECKDRVGDAKYSTSYFRCLDDTAVPLVSAKKMIKSKKKAIKKAKELSAASKQNYYVFECCAEVNYPWPTEDDIEVETK